MLPLRIFKILTRNQYLPSTVHSSSVSTTLDIADGFIHLSTALQLPTVLSSFFAPHIDDSIFILEYLLARDSNNNGGGGDRIGRLDGVVKWEAPVDPPPPPPSTSFSSSSSTKDTTSTTTSTLGLFPHYYGPPDLTVGDAVKVYQVFKKNGTFDLDALRLGSSN